MRIRIFKWLPAMLMMLIIFMFSAQPSSNLPNFEWADRIVKKGSHMVGYALLALSYWRAFQFEQRKRGFAWFLAILYAITDEFHQSFVPGRNASMWDVVIFDNLGTLISLWLFAILKTKRSDVVHPIVKKVNAKP